jgi:lipopolysaccharide biosynthesis glycosyltransferase
MNIVCATDGNYLPHCGIMLQSLLSQTAESEKLRVFLIIDNVSSQAFKLVVPHLYQILPSLSILRADPTCLKNFPVNGHASVATYFRLLLPSLLPAEIDRVLFIDADTVVTADLQELWHQPLQGKALGAVPEHISSCRDHNYTFGDYFNAGVMLVDLQRWRQADVLAVAANLPEPTPTVCATGIRMFSIIFS